MQLRASQTDFLDNPAKLRALFLDNVEKVTALEVDNAEIRPKVAAAAYEHLTRADGTFYVTDVGKTLGMWGKHLVSAQKIHLHG